MKTQTEEQARLDATTPADPMAQVTTPLATPPASAPTLRVRTALTAGSGARNAYAMDG